MKASILIIDDEESIRFSFKNFLSNEGHEILTAENYDSAIDIINKKSFDLMFVDIILGTHTGIDILMAVKERGIRCPVIMVTGEPNIETSAESIRGGAFDYISKPVRKETLLQVTNRALQHKALTDEKNLIEAEKERYRQNLEAIFRSLQDSIVTVDHEMRVIEANASTKNICGFSPEDIVGLKFTEIPNICNKTCFNVLKETLKTKNTIKEYRIECQHQNRPNQVVLLTSSPLTDKNNRFMGAVVVARDITRLTDLVRQLKERHKFHNIIGKSTKMQEIYKLLEDLSETATTVLVTGESGTGKEVVAKALHYSSTRALKPIVTVNCSALAENLLENELFGHVKGAYTGAINDKAGRFQMADGGTIFLDEIGDISPRIQLKLLRVLQEREIERVGDFKTIEVDVRVIAATNRNLKEKVKSGEFREDLYYRLKVIELSLPPLKERREDIPILVDHFIRMFNDIFNKNIDGVSNEVLSAFMSYPWPGNVRELKHALEHAFVLCHDRTLMYNHLPVEIRDYSKNMKPAAEPMADTGPRELLEALNRTDWNKAKAARVMGISRMTLYRKIKKYKIKPPNELNVNI